MRQRDTGRLFQMARDYVEGQRNLMLNEQRQGRQMQGLEVC